MDSDPIVNFWHISDTAKNTQNPLIVSGPIYMNTNKKWQKPNNFDAVNRIANALEKQQQTKQANIASQTNTKSSKFYVKNSRYQLEQHSLKIEKLKSLFEQLPLLQPKQTKVPSVSKIIIQTTKREQQLRSKQFTPDLGDQEFTQILSNHRYKQQQPTKSEQEHQLSEYTHHLRKHSKVKEFSQFILDQITKKPAVKKPVKLDVSQFPTRTAQKTVRNTQLNFFKTTRKSGFSNNHDLTFDFRNSQRESFYKEGAANRDRKSATQRSSRTQIKLEMPLNDSGNSSKVSAYDTNTDGRGETRNKFLHAAKTIVSKIHHTSPSPSPNQKPQIPHLHLFEDLISPKINAVSVLKTCRRPVTLKDQSPRIDQSAFSMMTGRGYKKTNPFIMFQQIKSPVLPKILRSQPVKFEIIQLNRDLPSNNNTELGVYKSQLLSRNRIQIPDNSFNQTSSQSIMPQAMGPSNVSVVAYHQEKRGRKIIMQYPTERSPKRILSEGFESPRSQMVSQPLR